MNNQNQLPVAQGSNGETNVCEGNRERRTKISRAHPPPITWTNSQPPTYPQYHPPTSHIPNRLGFGSINGPLPLSWSRPGLQSYLPNPSMAISNKEQFRFPPNNGGSAQLSCDGWNFRPPHETHPPISNTYMQSTPWSIQQSPVWTDGHPQNHPSTMNNWMQPVPVDTGYEPPVWTGPLQYFPPTSSADSHVYPYPSHSPSLNDQSQLLLSHDRQHPLSNGSATINNPVEFVLNSNVHPLPPRPPPALSEISSQSSDHSTTMENIIQHAARNRSLPLLPAHLLLPPPPCSTPPPPPPTPPPPPPPHPPADCSPTMNDSKWLGNDTPLKDTKTKKGPGPGAALCANCNAASHRLEKCLGPLVGGMLPGCPHHNSLNHSFDNCRDPYTQSKKALLWYMVESRSGRPPIMSTLDWRYIPEATESKCRPWSISFAIENSSFYKYYDYTKDSIPNQIPLTDPGWSNGTLWRFGSPYKAGHFIGPSEEHVISTAPPTIELDYGDPTPKKSSPVQKPLQFRIPQRVLSPPRVSSKIQQAFNSIKRVREDDEIPNSSSPVQKRSQSGRWHEVETAVLVPQNIRDMFNSMQTEVDKFKKIAMDAKQTASEAKQSAMEAEIASLKRQLAAQNQDPRLRTPSPSTHRVIRTAPFEYIKENNPPIKQENDGEIQRKGRGTFTSTAPPSVPSFRNADV